MKWNVFVLAETTKAVFLTDAMRIISGIGARNALSIETSWAPELSVNVSV